MSKTKKTVARADPKYGVVHRDISASYELAMFRKYGYNWKQKMRKLGESLRHAADTPTVNDQPLPETELKEDQ